MSILFRDYLDRDLIFKIHSPENGLNNLLSAEPYYSRFRGAGTTVAVVVILIYDHILYMCGPVLQQYNHGTKIN